MNSEVTSGEISTPQMESPRSSLQSLIQNAIKTVEDLTELDREVVARDSHIEDLEAKLMVAEAKIAALQSDLDSKEDERKLYYDKFKQYGRENRELKKKLAETETNKKPESTKSTKVAKTKGTSHTTKPTEPASTSQTPPMVQPKLGITIETSKLKGFLGQHRQPTVTTTTSQMPPSAFRAKPTSSEMSSKDKRRSSIGSVKSPTALSDKNSLEPSPRKKLCQELFGSFSSKDESSSSSSSSFSSSSDYSDSSKSGAENDPPALTAEVKIENIENNNSNSIENIPSTSTAHPLEPRSFQTDAVPESSWRLPRPATPTASNPTGFVCRLCEPRCRPFPFKTINHYRIHIKHVHFHNEQLYFCGFCPYHTIKKCDIKRHEAIHHVCDTEASYICEICTVHFSNKASLSKHYNSYHP